MSLDCLSHFSLFLGAHFTKVFFPDVWIISLINSIFKAWQPSDSKIDQTQKKNFFNDFN